MFITDEQKHQIREWLDGMQLRTDWMSAVAHFSGSWEEDLTSRLAAERALHTSCEYMTDIASLIIDAMVMRDPGGYADIVKVLVEEGVLDAAWFRDVEGVFGIRTILLRDHAKVTPSLVRSAVEQYGPLFPAFKEQIEDYLKL